MNTRRVERFIELVYEHDELGDLDPDARRRAIAALAARVIEPDDIAPTVAAVEAELFGWGPLEDALADPDVTDVLVNGPEEIWVDRSGHLERTPAAFRGPDHLLECTHRWFSRCGGRIDHLHPLADVVTPDGMRLHAALPPIASHGPLLSIRRLAHGTRTLDDLEALSCVTSAQRVELDELVRGGATMVIGGRTGCGKTTLLDALCRAIPEHERVVVIEETKELRSATAHAVSLVTRSGNAEGFGAVDLDQLVRAALRMRPDRIVVGEVRGVEAWPALRAMTTGHSGSMLTVHARAATDVPETLAFLALPAASGCSHAELVVAFERVIDVIVYMERAGATRRVVEIRHRQ